MHPRYGPGSFSTDSLGPRMLYFSPERHRRGWVRRPDPSHTGGRSVASRDTATVAIGSDDRPDRSADLASRHRQLTPDLARELMVFEYHLPSFAADYPFRRGVGYIDDPNPYLGCDEQFRSDRAGWVIPETDGAGTKVVGGSLRVRFPHPESPKKKSLPGTHRGVTFDPDNLGADGPIVVVEGASDEFALSLAGMPTVGRPSNAGGVADLIVIARRFPGRLILIVAERDHNPETGEWPGLTGARHVAAKLVDAVPDVVVAVALIPGGEKDPRGWLNARTSTVATQEEYRQLVRQLGAELEAAAVRVAQVRNPVTDLRYPNGPERCSARGTGATLQKKRDPRVNLAVHSACRRHSCPGCHRRLIRTAVFELADHITRDAEHRLQPVAQADTAPQSCGAENPPPALPSRLWAAVDPPGKWDTLRNRLGRLDATGWVRVEVTSPAGDGFGVILDAVRDAATTEPRTVDTQANRRARGVNLVTLKEELRRYEINSTRSPADANDLPEGEEPQGDSDSDADPSTIIQINSTRPPVGTASDRGFVFLLASLPPHQEPGPGFAEVGVGDALDLMNHACLRVPTTPRTGKRCRPIVSSYSWPITGPEEKVPEFRRLGSLVGSTADAAELATELGLDVNYFNSADLIEPGAVCLGEEARAFVLARLAESDMHHPARRELARLWAKVIPPSQPVGNLFCEYVVRHLTNGPPATARADFHEIASRDAIRLAEERRVSDIARDIPDEAVECLLDPEVFRSRREREAQNQNPSC